MQVKRTVRVLAFVILSFVPGYASAQQAAGGIAGVVRDASGGVLPGVTVEASSPALIGGSRSATTDGQGQYKITELGPGVYVVAFSLTGFTSVRREGIELSTAFVATVNAEMKVGSVEETITVSGQSPTVDVHNVVEHQVLTREVFDALPTGKSAPAFGALTPAIIVPADRQDVGGNKGELGFRMVVHGGSQLEQRLLQDGMRYNSAEGSGRTFFLNPASNEEVNIELGGGGAESELGGVQLNSIPKSGSNSLKSYFFLNGTTGDLQGNNLTDALKARGLTSSNRVLHIWDESLSFGGPIRRDRIWFFVHQRSWGNQSTVAGNYFNANPPGSLVHTPDLSKPALYRENDETGGGRVTWQISKNDKVSGSIDIQHDYQDQGANATTAPEAYLFWYFYPDNLLQGTWQHTFGSRVLMEAGNTSLWVEWPNIPPGAPSSWATPVDGAELTKGISILRQEDNYRFGSAASGYGRRIAPQSNQRFSVSYVTGSHAFKTGMFTQEGRRSHDNIVYGDMNYRFLNGAPNQVTLWATPITYKESLNLNLGLFAQDQWTIDRLTLNLGLRYDYLSSSVPEQHLPAGPFVPARNYAPVPCVPCWSDLNPRVSAAYDIFGTGRTALKVNMGRYILGEFVGTARLNNPVNTSVNSANRTWNDTFFPVGDARRGNFAPDCDFSNSAANNECGVLQNLAFGTVTPNSVSAPEVLNGFGNRPYQWQFSASAQHELLPQLSLSGGYYRTWYGNFTLTDNLNAVPADYSTYCITGASDPRLPNGGGEQICGLADLNPVLLNGLPFNNSNNLIDFADKYGSMFQIYNGFDYVARFRFRRGAFLQVGGNTGRTVGAVAAANNGVGTQYCFVVDTPDKRFCEIRQPFLTQVKLNGSYTWPAEIQTSAVYQNLPGIPLAANQTVTNAQIVPSLGRNLSAGAGSTVTVPLIRPYSMFEDRLQQLDIRVARMFRLGRARLQGMLDIYNILNASTVLGVNVTYGTSWLRPTEVLGARLFKFGMQLDF